jgi:hypothetical protein
MLHVVPAAGKEYDPDGHVGVIIYIYRLVWKVARAFVRNASLAEWLRRWL